MNDNQGAMNLVSGMSAKTANLPSARIAYSEGPKNGPPLMLIPGWSDSRDTYTPVVPELMKSFHIFAIDQRGHGLSEHPESGYTTVNYSDDAGEFIEQVIGQESMIWGQSLGAAVTLVTAHRFPDRVRAIVVEDPPLMRTKTGLAEDFLQATIELATIMRRQPTMAELEVLLSEIEMIREMGEEVIRKFAENLMRTDSRTIDSAISGEAVREYHPLDSFLKIQCPALLMQADPAAGGLIPDDHMESLLPLLANWTHKRYSDQPHNIHEADPKLAVGEAIEFFSQH